MKILDKTQRSSGRLILLAFAFFFVGFALTTLLPWLIETSWGVPTEHSRPYTELEARGKDLYADLGCWYCHTQQIRTLEADTKRYGWRGVDAPISVPGEYTRDAPHMLGTRRIGPDLARVGGKYDVSWHRTHFNSPPDLVPGSIMPPMAWLVTRNGGKDLEALNAYLQTLGRTLDWRPAQDYER